MHGVKNSSDGATWPNKKSDDIFSLVDTIHQRDRRTDRQTDRPGSTGGGANWALAPKSVISPHGSEGLWGLSCKRLSLKLLVCAMYFSHYYVVIT